MTDSNLEKLYVFKVWLQGCKSIWRRIAMPGGNTLLDFHGMIFKAFDREEDHLAGFYIAPPGTRGGRQARLKAATVYLVDEDEDAPSLDDPREKYARDARIEDLAVRAGTIWDYLFDYGDSWWHEIELESVTPLPRTGKFPAITGRKGASPPQYGDEDPDAGYGDDFDDEVGGNR